MTYNKEKARQEHKEKYRALNKKCGVAWTGNIMPPNYTAERLKEGIKEDPHLNFIPLRWWDSLALSMIGYHRGGVALSLSDGVCMQKQACRDYLETI